MFDFKHRTLSIGNIGLKNVGFDRIEWTISLPRFKNGRKITRIPDYLRGISYPV